MNSLVRRLATVSISRAKCSVSTLSGVATTSTASTPPMNMSTTMPNRLQYIQSTDLSPSTTTATATTTQRKTFSTEVSADVAKNLTTGSETAAVFTDGGEQFGMVLDTRHLPKLKPGLVRRRLAKMKTYIGREKTIRQSPWKLNRVCQLAAGLTLDEALTQLKFCDIKNADLVAKVLRRTSNLADIRDGLQISQLEVAECFTTKSMMLKRMKTMGRGRSGIMHHKYSHIRAVLREIDFPLKIYQAHSLNQKKKWLLHQQRAKQDAQAAKAKRDETERLLKQEEQQREERLAAAANKKD